MLTPIRLAWRSLVYHRRGNAAVALGVAVGSAVLTGALLVGDSLREGLRALSLSHLGWVHETLSAPRFIGGHIVPRAGPVQPICGAIMVHGAITADAGKGTTTQAQVIGAPSQFWTAGDTSGTAAAPIDSAWWDSDQSGAVVNWTLAETLSLKTGDWIQITVERTSSVPRESLMGRKDPSDVISRIRLRIRQILGDFAMSSFSPRPGLEAPKTVFLPLAALQRELRQTGRINMVLAGPGDAAKMLRESLTLDDWGLRVLDPARRTEELFARLDRNHDGILQPREWKDGLGTAFARQAAGRDNADLTKEQVLEYFTRQHGYISLDSKETILPPAVEHAALRAAADLHMQAAPTLVYLANMITEGNHSVPYSIIAALDSGLAPPLGPFLPEDSGPLRDDEIILVHWKDAGLSAKVGDRIQIRYFDPLGTDRPERSHDFRLRALMPLTGAAADQDLTPPFSGVTDKLDIRSWDPPFPYDNRRITARDEAYWNEYRTTPKAYVTLAAGRALWASRFGQSTSIRMAPPTGRSLDQAAADFERKLLSRLSPEDGGLSFVPVRQQALEAGNAGTKEFGWLFLSFSIFLVAAALMLVSLVAKLNLEQRSAQLGLLSALGWPARRVRRLLVAEQAIACGIGDLLGLAGAWLYARYLLALLRAQWPIALERDVTAFRFGGNVAQDLAIGAAAAWLLAMITVFLAARGMLRLSPRELLAGYRARRISVSRAGRWSRIVAAGCAVLALVSLAAGFFVKDAESRASSFFSSGAFALAAGVMAARLWMLARAHSRHAVGQPRVVSLAVQNACRAIGRSLTTIAVVASAIFVIVAVSSFRRDPDVDITAKNAGTGGFTLVGRSTVPIFQDLNTEGGRLAAGLRLDASELAGTSICPLRARQGDDASCLNLYEPNQPRIIGVGQSFIDRAGFTFADSLAHSDAEKKNPWLLLEGDSSGGIPAVADAATATWKLHKKLGDTIDLEIAGSQKLRLVGLLDESILQSELIVSEANFVRIFPRDEGYTEFLIETPPGRAASVRRGIETALATQGFEAVSTKDRLDAYFGVENAYLGTFQVLGSLGLVLGSLGMAIVLVRTVWERRGELALLRALGFRRRVVRVLIFVESAFLLMLGLGLGTLAAVLAVAPEIRLSEGVKVLGHTTALVALTLVVSLGAAGLAVTVTLRARLIEALRTE